MAGGSCQTARNLDWSRVSKEDRADGPSRIAATSLTLPPSLLVGAREGGREGKETCRLTRGGGGGAVRGAELGEGAKLCW